MNNILRFLIALCVWAPFSVVAQSQHYELQLPDFNELLVADAVNVQYYCDPVRAGLIEFDSQSDRASSVVFECKKGKLTVQLAERGVVTANLPTIHVYSTFLTKATNEGDSLLLIDSIAPQGKFTARLVGNGRLRIYNIHATSLDAAIVSGNGTITLSGVADNARLVITGTGHIYAPELHATQANCSITGTGAITLSVTDLLSASGLGSGNIYYIGSPKVNKKFLSTVKVNPYRQDVK